MMSPLHVGGCVAAVAVNSENGNELNTACIIAGVGTFAVDRMVDALSAPRAAHRTAARRVRAAMRSPEPDEE